MRVRADTPRIRIDGRRDDMLRVQAVNVYPQAISAILAAEPRLGRHCVVAEGDPVVPPLRLYVEAPPDLDLAGVEERLHSALRARFALTRLEPGSLPVAEHKTRIVHRTARGDPLPDAVAALGRGARPMTVTTADLGAARVITWDRQERRNAWDLPTMTAIAAEIEVAGRDTAVRMIAVRGAGGHFSAGDDLQAAIEADTAAWTETIEAFQRMTRVVLAAPVPAVAVVDGVCVGGALEFAASCDLRLCSNRVRLLTPEVGIGLVASNAGTLLLPQVLGESAARELLLSGEERDAGWAHANGFATELVAPAELDKRIAHWAEIFARTSRTPSRPRSRCSTSASASSSPRRWSGRPTTACACSTSPTPARRSARSPSADPQRRARLTRSQRLSRSRRSAVTVSRPVPQLTRSRPGRTSALAAHHFAITKVIFRARDRLPARSAARSVARYEPGASALRLMRPLKRSVLAPPRSPRRVRTFTFR